MVTFGNRKVHLCVVRIGDSSYCCCCHRSFLNPIVQVFISLCTSHSHCLFVRSLALASLLCSFQHPHICTATCKGLTFDAWHFAFTSTTCTVNSQCLHCPNETVLFHQLAVHIALKGGSPNIRTKHKHSDPAAAVVSPKTKI